LKIENEKLKVENGKLKVVFAEMPGVKDLRAKHSLAVDVREVL
jgi:hypothetical protein